MVISLKVNKKTFDIVELITRRRRQVLVHSCIYYRFGTSIISDYKFDEWAYELVHLQKKYPAESKQAELYNMFKDFDGSTGYHLPLGDPWLVMLAKHLIDNHRRKTNGRNSKQR